MSKTSARRKRDRNRKRQRLQTDLADATDQDRPHDTASYAEANGDPGEESAGSESVPAPEVTIDDIRETLDDGDVLVDLACGDDGRHVVYSDTTIAGAAEAAAAAYVVSLGQFPEQPISCTCYTNFGQFGPFPVELSLECDAKMLRGGE